MPGGPPSGRPYNGKSKPQVVSGHQVAEHHLQSFEVCYQRGQIGKSFSHLSLALCILPQIKEQYYSRYLDIFERWSATVEENNGFQQAMTIFEVALNRYPDSADIHHLLAKTLYRNGNIHEAWTYALMAQKVCAHDPNTLETRARLTNALVDRWHLPMLNDVCRNSAFKSAIERAVCQGHNTVLDIGSGTGLLSMYAKLAGARSVYACEADKFMCEMSGNILQANPSASNIQILPHHSTSLSIPSHIPERVSLIVSETVDAGLLGEHILSTLEHAWENLLLPPPPSPKAQAAENKQLCLPQGCCTSSDCDTGECASQPVSGRVIPQKAEVFIALISCDYIARQTKLKNPDVPYFKNKKVSVKLEEPYMSERLSQVPGGFTLLSKWISLTSINFNSPDDIKTHLNGDISTKIEITSVKSGVPDAIVLAFNLYLNDDEYISTNPETGTTFWENAVYPIMNLPKVNIGETVEVNFSCHGVISLSVVCRNENEDYIKLSPDTLMFLNSESMITAFHKAAQQAACFLKKQAKSKAPDPFIICDTAPFPVAGLALLSEFPNCKLYIEDETTQQTLKDINIDAHLCEDLEDEVDILFMWPLTKEGSLKDGLIKKVLMYRLMMAENSYVFPQALDLLMSVIESSTLSSMTRVNDSNTCGIKIAEAFNIVKTLHHLDVPLEALPHSLVIPNPVQVLRLSLTSADVEPGSLMKEERSESSSDMLVLGGEILQYTTEFTIPRASTITGIPYWFVLHGSIPSTTVNAQSTASESNLLTQDITVSTRGLGSSCNQSILMLEEPLKVVENNDIGLKVNWREGVFSAYVKVIQES